MGGICTGRPYGNDDGIYNILGPLRTNWEAQGVVYITFHEPHLPRKAFGLPGYVALETACTIPRSFRNSLAGQGGSMYPVLRAASPAEDLYTEGEYATGDGIYDPLGPLETSW